MVAYLENHGVEKFSEIFLGEFDTPEAIWSADMRRHLIERIALHIADFSPRLMSNTRALYEYCAVPAVTYDLLEHELFCNVYYLRNLTDELRFVLDLLTYFVFYIFRLCVKVRFHFLF